MSLKLTHVDKIYWPKERIAKGDLLKYYAAIAKYILQNAKGQLMVSPLFGQRISPCSCLYAACLERSQTRFKSKKLHYEECS